VKLLKVTAKHTVFEECRVRTSRHLKNAFVSGVFKPGSEDDIKIIRKLFRPKWQYTCVPCRLTFERLATFQTAIPSERDCCTWWVPESSILPKVLSYCKTRSQAVARILYCLTADFL